jgi:hypothetical protein
MAFLNLFHLLYPGGWFLLVHIIPVLVDYYLANDVGDLRPDGVTIYTGRLAGPVCEYPMIERDGEKLERPMSSSGLWCADDDDNE